MDQASLLFLPVTGLTSDSGSTLINFARLAPQSQNKYEISNRFFAERCGTESKHAKEDSDRIWKVYI